MTRVRTNILANFTGIAWSSLLGVAFVPIYIRYLGAEVYGLIGAFVIIQAATSLLDAGMSATLSRELAYASGQQESRDVRHLARSLAVIYWLVGVVVCLAVVLLAPVLAKEWLQPEGLSADQVALGLTLMGINFALQWPATLYSGGLRGLQRHVALNAALAGSATVRGFGAVGVLVLVAPTIGAFFGWQILVSGAHTALLHWLLWRRIHRHEAGRPEFSWAELRRVWRFAAGMSGIGVLLVALTQVDKVILSRILSLELFGYYSFAAMVATALTRLGQPLFSALFPRFTELVGGREEANIARTYHAGCQLLTLALVPTACVIAAFAPEILWLWTRDSVLVANTATLLSLLIIGTALNGLLLMPAALQLAYGWTRLMLTAHAVAIVVLGPAIALAAFRWGAVGAASVWVVVNVWYVTFIPPLMHRRLLTGELGRYYVKDLGVPALIAISVTALLRGILPGGTSEQITLLYLAGAAALVLTASASSVPLARDQLRASLAGKSMVASATRMPPADANSTRL